MKRYILLLTLLIVATVTLQAQKAERKAVRTGNKAYKEQLYGNAEEEYKKAMEANAGSKEASFNLANTYYKQQRWDEALEEYRHYLTIESEDMPKMSAAWGNMGNVFLKKEAEKSKQQQQEQQQQADNLQMSMEAYKNSLRMNPSDDAVRHNLAVVQKIISDREKNGGQDDQKDDKEDEKKQDDKQEQKPEDKPNENKQNQEPPKQEQTQVAQDNVEQILKAIEQDEKETQERVKQGKAQERQRQNQHNRRHNKDW